MLKELWELSSIGTFLLCCILTFFTASGNITFGRYLLLLKFIRLHLQEVRANARTHLLQRAHLRDEGLYTEFASIQTPPSPSISGHYYSHNRHRLLRELQLLQHSQPIRLYGEHLPILLSRIDTSYHASRKPSTRFREPNTSPRSISTDISIKLEFKRETSRKRPSRVDMVCTNS